MDAILRLDQRYNRLIQPMRSYDRIDLVTRRMRRADGLYDVIAVHQRQPSADTFQARKRHFPACLVGASDWPTAGCVAFRPQRLSVGSWKTGRLANSTKSLRLEAASVRRIPPTRPAPTCRTEGDRLLRSRRSFPYSTYLKVVSFCDRARSKREMRRRAARLAGGIAISPTIGKARRSRGRAVTKPSASLRRRPRLSAVLHPYSPECSTIHSSGFDYFGTFVRNFFRKSIAIHRLDDVKEF